MKKIFYLDNSPYLRERFLIRVDHNNFYCKGTSGSYNILMARLLGLDYPSFLRMCRDIFGAKVYGKNSLYPVPYFSDKAKVKKLVEMLNICANYVIFDKEHPDYEEHEKIMIKVKNNEKRDDLNDK